MARKLVLVLLVVLSVLCAGCKVEEMTAAEMDKAAAYLTVDHIAKWQAEARANGPECKLGWIKGSLDFGTRLELLHACFPKAEDAEEHAELLLSHIRECCGICVNGFADGSDGQAECTEQCRGGYEGSLE